MATKGMCSSPKHEDAEIKNLRYNRTVKPGDTYQIDFDVDSLAKYMGDTITIVIMDEGVTPNTVLYTTTFDLGAKQSQHIRFSSKMPDRDIPIGIAVWDINTAYPDTCEDTKRFTIEKGETTTPAIPTTDTKTLDWYYYALIVLIILSGLYFLLIYMKKRR